MTKAAIEAGYMSAPCNAPKTALKLPLAQGAAIHVAQIAFGDSFHESSMIAGGHEQLGPYEVQDHELVDLQ